MHPARLSVTQFLKSCTFEAVRRSGPGGQRKNKVFILMSEIDRVPSFHVSWS